REEGGERGCAHGGEVAEASGEAAVADGLGRMEVAAEVADFEAEVGGDEDFCVGRRAEDGAVVADAEGDCAATGRCGEGAANLLDQSEFSHRLLSRVFARAGGRLHTGGRINGWWEFHRSGR